MQHAELTEVIIGAFYHVYNRLGFRFLESVYAAALERALMKRGIAVAREVLVPVYFEGDLIAYQRLDMLVENTVVVEVKAGELLSRTAAPQLFNYLHATKLEVGLLLHFGREPEVIRRTHPNP
jgi:GxxExxY protein